MGKDIIVIILGLIIWKLVPGWITEGKKKVRDKIKLACNIIGVILVILGCYLFIVDGLSWTLRSI